jgi:hypothetical protein
LVSVDDVDVMGFTILFEKGCGFREQRVPDLINGTHVIPTDDLHLTDLIPRSEEHFPSLREQEVVASVNPVLDNRIAISIPDVNELRFQNYLVAKVGEERRRNGSYVLVREVAQPVVVIVQSQIRVTARPSS